MHFSFVLCSLLVGIISATPIPQTTVSALAAQAQAQGAEVVVVSHDGDSEGEKLTMEVTDQGTTEELQPASETALDPATLFVQLWNLRRPNDDEHMDDAKYEEYENRVAQDSYQLGNIDF